MFKSHLFSPKALPKRDYALWDGAVVLRTTNDTPSASSLSQSRQKRELAAAPNLAFPAPRRGPTKAAAPHEAPSSLRPLPKTQQVAGRSHGSPAKGRRRPPLGLRPPPAGGATVQRPPAPDPAQHAAVAKPPREGRPRPPLRESGASQPLRGRGAEARPAAEDAARGGG